MEEAGWGCSGLHENGTLLKVGCKARYYEIRKDHFTLLLFISYFKHTSIIYIIENLNVFRFQVAIAVVKPLQLSIF